MTGYSIEISKMSGKTVHIDFISGNFNSFYCKMPHGLENYNGRMSTDIEKMIEKDIKFIRNLDFEEPIPIGGNWILGKSNEQYPIVFCEKKLLGILFWHLNRLKELSRKFPTCYWYLDKSNKKNYKSNLSLSNNNLENDYINYNSISSYIDALKLHIYFINKSDKKMANLMWETAKKMKDYPDNFSELIFNDTN